MTRQDFTTADLISLEVQANDLPTTNLIKNPVPDLGTYLWETPQNTTVLAPDYSQPILPVFRLSVTTASTPTALHAAVPVTPGKYLGVGVNFIGRSTSAESGALVVAYNDAAGNILTVVTSPTMWAGGPTYLGMDALLVPAGAVSAFVGVSGYSGAGGFMQVGRWLTFTRLCARQHATAAGATNVTYTEPYEWLDVTGPALSISIPRAGFDLGSLTTVIRSAALDPAVSTALRPGRLLRLRCLAPDGTRQSLFRGKIRTAPTTYDYRQPLADRRNKITVTAVDPIAALGNTSRPYGVGTVAELAYIFESADAPWAVNGSGAQPAGTPTYVTMNASASLADQVAITRDSRRAYAWCDRRGVVQVVDSAALSTTSKATLDAAVYSDAEIGFDTSTVINTVTVKVVADDQTTDYGPYVDQASVNTWGAYSASFTVQGLANDGATIAAYAAAILAANAQPTVRISSVRIPIITAADLTTVTGNLRALLDLYDRVTVKGGTSTADDRFAPYPDIYPAAYPTALIQDALVTSIKHTITPNKWVVDIGLTSNGVAPLPQAVPTP